MNLCFEPFENCNMADFLFLQFEFRTIRKFSGEFEPPDPNSRVFGYKCDLQADFTFV